MNKEVKVLLHKVRQQGCEVERARSGHWRILRDGQLIGVAPFSPHGDLWLRRLRNELRKKGVTI